MTTGEAREQVMQQSRGIHATYCQPMYCRHTSFCGQGDTDFLLPQLPTVVLAERVQAAAAIGWARHLGAKQPEHRFRCVVGELASCGGQRRRGTIGRELAVP